MRAGNLPEAQRARSVFQTLSRPLPGLKPCALYTICGRQEKHRSMARMDTGWKPMLLYAPLRVAGESAEKRFPYELDFIARHLGRVITWCPFGHGTSAQGREATWHSQLGCYLANVDLRSFLNRKPQPNIQTWISPAEKQRHCQDVDNIEQPILIQSCT